MPLPRNGTVRKGDPTQALREWRKALGISQAELARRLGFSRKTMERWEVRGVVPPKWLELAMAELSRRMKRRRAFERCTPEELERRRQARLAREARESEREEREADYW